MLHYHITSKDMLGMPRKHSISMGEELLKGNMVVDQWIREVTSFSVETFDWDMTFSASPTTFQLFLQGLTPVAFLVGHYVLTGHIEAYALAEKLVQSWMDFYPEDMSTTPDAPNSYTWDQHAVALRTEALLYFLLVGYENDFLSEEEEYLVCRHIQQHASYLKNPNYYLENENHGVFEDRALLYYSYAFSDESGVETAVARLRRQWAFLFTKSGVCVENSYAYHRVNKDLFVEISKVLSKYDHPFSQELRETLLAAENFMGYALLPDKTSPPYGDSQKDSYVDAVCTEPDGVFAFACGANTAVTPLKTRMVYPDAGYYVGREFWNASEKNLQNSDSFWVMFRSGYQSITHRHADDNSFMLYARGHDVFVDSGSYNYMFRDPMRRYVRSANAHNTVVVDETSYDFLRKDATKLSGIFAQQMDEAEKCDYMAAYNLHRAGITHVRHFFYYTTDVIIIDEMFSRQSHRYSQLFHCGKDIKITNATDQETLLHIADTEYSVVLRQHMCCSAVKVFNGMKQGTLYGNISEQFNEVIETNTLKYDLVGSNASFVTQISLVDANGGSVSGLSFAFDTQSRTLTVRDAAGEVCNQQQLAVFDASSVFRFQMTEFDIRCTTNEVFITNMNQYSEPVQYAWYLLGADKKTIYKQTQYSDSPEFVVNMDEEQIPQDTEYTVRAFVYNKGLKRKAAQNVGRFCLEGEEITFVRDMAYDVQLRDWLD